MTVKELIEELEKIEDEDREVQVYIASGGISGVLGVSEVEEETNENVYIHAID